MGRNCGRWLLIVLVAVLAGQMAWARTWTIKGKPYEGDLQKVTDDAVFLRSPRGGTRIVQRSDLSDEDRQYIRQFPLNQDVLSRTRPRPAPVAPVEPVPALPEAPAAPNVYGVIPGTPATPEPVIAPPPAPAPVTPPPAPTPAPGGGRDSIYGATTENVYGVPVAPAPPAAVPTPAPVRPPGSQPIVTGPNVDGSWSGAPSRAQSSGQDKVISVIVMVMVGGLCLVVSLAIWGYIVYVAARICRVEYVNYGKCIATVFLAALASFGIQFVMVFLPFRSSVLYSALLMVIPIVVAWLTVAKCLDTPILRALLVMLVSGLITLVLVIPVVIAFAVFGALKLPF